MPGIVSLTGYEYFEYAHKARRRHLISVKPVTTEKLLKAVKRAALDIEKKSLCMRQGKETGI